MDHGVIRIDLSRSNKVVINYRRCGFLEQFEKEKGRVLYRKRPQLKLGYKN